MLHCSRVVNGFQSRVSPTRPESICVIIHRAMSLAPALMPPAGSVFGSEKGFTTWTVPFTRAWVVATLPEASAAEAWVVVAWRMPTGRRIRVVTKSDQLCPETRWISWPATR